MVKNPEDRLEAVRPVVERLGGKVRERYLSFGEYDIVAIFELPSNVSAAAYCLAVSAGGAVRAIKTTPLLTGHEGVVAMNQARTIDYRPPGLDVGYTAS